MHNSVAVFESMLPPITIHDYDNFLSEYSDMEYNQ